MHPGLSLQTAATPLHFPVVCAVPKLVAFNEGDKHRTAKAALTSRKERIKYKLGELRAKIAGVYADGHAAKFGREKFVAYSRMNPALREASNITQYCNVMDQRNLHKFWGRAWATD